PLPPALSIYRKLCVHKPRSPNRPINGRSRQARPARTPRMDQSTEPLPSERAEESASKWPELVVQNGRLSGTRKVLTAAITTIGREESCDLRLNVESVHPFQCVLAFGPTGLSLRALQANNGTLVNGQEVSSCTLHEGDLLCLGP